MCTLHSQKEHTSCLLLIDGPVVMKSTPPDQKSKAVQLRHGLALILGYAMELSTSD